MMNSTMIKLTKMDENLSTPRGKTGKLEMFAATALGYGSMGTCVYKGLFEKYTEVAIKSIPRHVFKGLNGSLVEASEIDEVKILKKFNHPNLVKYFIFEYDDLFIYIALELCQGTLVDFVEKYTDPTYDGKKYILHGIMQGLDELHNLSIVHGDLKPQNILLKSINPTQDGMLQKAVISDFGLSLEIEPGKRSKTVADGKIGTKGWRAKELIVAIENAENSSKKPSCDSEEVVKVKCAKSTDIFAVGCVMQYVMSDGETRLHPFGEDAFRDRNIKGESRWSYLSTKKDKTLDEVLADMLIQLCIAADRDLRPGTKEINKHPFFWDSEAKYKFIEQISNDIKFVNEDFRKMLEDRWREYHPRPISLKPKQLMDTIKNDKKLNFKEYSLVAYIRLIRNIKQHYPEKKEMYGNILKEGTEDDIVRHFLNNVVHVLPVLYACFHKCPENKKKVYQSFFIWQGLEDDRYKVLTELLSKIFIPPSKRGISVGGEKRPRIRTSSGNHND